MKVLVTGGRGYADTEFLYKVLDIAHRADHIDMVIHGAAPGADTLAGQWARNAGVQEVVCPANWAKHGLRAGRLRNIAMAELAPDKVIAFPGNVGTNMMIEIAEKRGIKVINAASGRQPSERAIPVQRKGL